MIAVRPGRPSRPSQPKPPSARVDRGFRVLDTYTTAWQVGTGLRVALPPGTYAITRRESRGAEPFVLLEDAYWLRPRD